jgi:hypothetical protein
MFETDQLYAQVMLLLDAFDAGWNIALVVLDFICCCLAIWCSDPASCQDFRRPADPCSPGYLIDSLGKILCLIEPDHCGVYIYWRSTAFVPFS